MATLDVYRCSADIEGPKIRPRLVAWRSRCKKTTRHPSRYCPAHRIRVDGTLLPAREPDWTPVRDESARTAHTWLCTMPDGSVWELERRGGIGEDFGWYLYGPGGEPFGLYLSRRLGPAQRMAQDYAVDVPGCRRALHGAQPDDGDPAYQYPDGA